MSRYHIARQYGERLSTWLADRDGKHLTTTPGPNNSEVAWFSVKGKTMRKLLLIQGFGNGGWDVFVPLTESDDVDRTFELLGGYLADEINA